MTRILLAQDAPPSGGGTAKPTGTPPDPSLAPATPPAAGGSSSLVDSLIKDDDVLPPPAAEPSKPAEPAKPAEAAKPNAAEPAKPVEPPKKPAMPAGTPPPAKPAAPAEKPLDWKTAPDQFKKAHETLLETHKRLETEYNTFKTTNAAQQQEVQKKLAELEKKRFWTPEDETRYAALENRSKDIEAELYARDYEASPEYKKEYTDKWQGKYAEAVATVKSMTVSYQDGDEAKTREGTKADFDKIRALADNPAAMRQMAKQMFPEDWAEVLDGVKSLKFIEKNAAEAVSQHRQQYDERMKDVQHRTENMTREQQAAAQAAEAELVKAHPQFFADDPTDPKATEALKGGLKFVDESYSREVLSKMTPAQVAERATTVRYMAGAFPRLVHSLKKLQSDLASKETELAKYRGTDPGAGGDAPPPTPEPTKNNGVSSFEEALRALEDK